MNMKRDWKANKKIHQTFTTSLLSVIVIQIKNGLCSNGKTILKKSFDTFQGRLFRIALHVLPSLLISKHGGAVTNNVLHPEDKALMSGSI